MGWLSVLGEILSNPNAIKDTVENVKESGSYILGEVASGFVTAVDCLAICEDKIDGRLANIEKRKQGKANEGRIEIVESELSEWKYSTPCKYDNIRFDLQFPYYSVKVNGKWGVIDADDNIVIPFEYDYLGIYNEGKIAAKRGEKFGYINLENDMVIPFEFDYAKRFRNGIAPVAVIRDEEALYGFIDANGEFVIPPQFDYAEPFRKNGIAIVGKYSEYDSNSKKACYHKGVINASGKTLLNLRYKEIDIYDDYIKGVFLDGIINKTVFFDINGMPLEEYQEKHEPLEKNKLYVYYNGELKYGYFACNESGRDICKIKPIFQDAFPFNEYGYAPVKLNNQYGIIKLIEK